MLRVFSGRDDYPLPTIPPLVKYSPIMTATDDIDAADLVLLPQDDVFDEYSPELLEGALTDMETIAGQKPVVTRAKKSLASFKLREDQAIGCKVTLRGDRMYEFLDRLISLAIPRIRDFRGLSPKSFDGNGNYTFGVTEQLMFPEIDYDKVDTTRGMDITIVTTAKSNDHGRALLGAFSFPFRREGQ